MRDNDYSKRLGWLAVKKIDWSFVKPTLWPSWTGGPCLPHRHCSITPGYCNIVHYNLLYIHVKASTESLKKTWVNQPMRKNECFQLNTISRKSKTKVHSHKCLAIYLGRLVDWCQRQCNRWWTTVHGTFVNKLKAIAIYWPIVCSSLYWLHIVFQPNWRRCRAILVRDILWMGGNCQWHSIILYNRVKNSANSSFDLMIDYLYNRHLMGIPKCWLIVLKWVTK